MKTWFVDIGFTADKPIDDDAAFALMGALGGVPMSRSLSANGGTIGVFVDADTPDEAFKIGSKRVLDATAKTLGPAELAWFEVTPEDDVLRENSTPLFPEVVGYAEIAEMAGVSRQTARGYAMSKTFPKPIIETAQGPLMAKSAVERWLESRPTSRRKKALATA
ncbi:MAG TPA: hypothetical protein GX406_02355 [Pseudoclavibacter sp.]|nr:hypothetical protein [Pseudoclavibacter sp.]